MSKKTPFKIPSNYFEDFETSFLSKERKKEKDLRFITPIRYFEEIEKIIFQRIRNTRRVIYLNRAMRIAASFTLLFVLFNDIMEKKEWQEMPITETYLNTQLYDSETLETFYLINDEAISFEDNLSLDTMDSYALLDYYETQTLNYNTNYFDYAE